MMIIPARTALLPIILTGVVFLLASLAQAAKEAKTEESTVERESSLEDCFTIEAGTELKWHWGSGEPLDFNIHYHREGKTVYPVKAPGATSGRGALSFEQPQKICLMWKNG